MVEKKQVLKYALMTLIFIELILVVVTVREGIIGYSILKESGNITLEDYFEEDVKDLVDADIEGTLEVITIENLEIKEEGVEVSYSFDNFGFIGNSISTVIWISNASKDEIERVYDTFPIDRDGPISRDVLIEIPSGRLNGVYFVQVALSNNLDNYAIQSFVMRNPSITGNVTIETQKAKLSIYAVFLVGIVIVIFIIARATARENINPKKKLTNG